MPKISAATVPEHRARQRRALIAAAVDILAESGAAAVTPAAVGARAGLARSSVYQYFPSTAALLAALVEEAFADWNATVATAMARAHTPAGRIDAYLSAALRLAAAGGHRAAAALSGADLPPECRRRVGELHREEAAPLAAAISDLGVPDPELTGQLLTGLLQAAMTAVENGADLATVTGRTLALLHDGLRPR